MLDNEILAKWHDGNNAGDGYAPIGGEVEDWDHKDIEAGEGAAYRYTINCGTDKALMIFERGNFGGFFAVGDASGAWAVDLA